MQSAVIWTSLDIRHVTESSHDATVTRHPARLKTSTMTVVSISSDPFAIGTSAVFGFFGVVVVVVVGSDDDDDIIIIVFVRAHRFPDDDDFKDDEKTPLPTRTTKRFPPPPLPPPRNRIEDDDDVNDDHDDNIFTTTTTTAHDQTTTQESLDSLLRVSKFVQKVKRFGSLVLSMSLDLRLGEFCLGYQREKR